MAKPLKSITFPGLDGEYEVPDIPVPISQGGTGAENAATALANLGAAAMVHDHANQMLVPSELTVYAPHQWPNIQLKSQEDASHQGRIQFDRDSRGMCFGVENLANGIGEYFTLPPISATETAWYGIHTDKNPIWIHQGGTGATDAVNARINLGLRDFTAYYFNKQVEEGGWASVIKENWESIRNGTFFANAGYVGQRAAFFGFKSGDYGIALLIAYSTTSVVLYRNVAGTWTERTI